MARKRAFASLFQMFPDLGSIVVLWSFQIVSIWVLYTFARMGVDQVSQATDYFHGRGLKMEAHEAPAPKAKRRTPVKNEAPSAAAERHGASAPSPTPPTAGTQAKEHASEDKGPSLDPQRNGSENQGNAPGNPAHGSENPSPAAPPATEPATAPLEPRELRPAAPAGPAKEPSSTAPAEPAKGATNTAPEKPTPGEDLAGAQCEADSPEGEPLPPIAQGPMTHDEECKAAAVHAAFQGLEFFLLAPLFFLLLRSLAQYITDLMMREVAHVDNPTSERFDKTSSAESEVGKESLLEAKSLSVGLLFAIVATHMVGKLVAGTYRQLSGVGDWGEVITGLSLLLLLGATYLFLVRITHSSHQK